MVPPRSQGGIFTPSHAQARGGTLTGPRRAARRHGRGVVVTAVLAALTVLIGPTAARAEPSVSDIENQIDRVWEEAEPLIEQYNAVHAEYEQNLAKQAELQALLQPLEDQLAEARRHVGKIAAQVYSGAGAGSVALMFETGTPGDFADRLAYLDVLSLSQARELSDVMALKAEYDAQKAPIDELVTALAAQDTDLASRKATIESRIGELQKLRRQAYAGTGGTGDFRPWPCPAEYAPTPGYQAAAWACAQAGIPYVWAGASSSGYDCSGLTMRAWQQVGIYLPHNAAAQRRSMPYVDRADLQVGDLVFFYSNLRHVGIYVGDNKIMHAPRTGDYVRMVSLDYGGTIHSYGRPG